MIAMFAMIVPPLQQLLHPRLPLEKQSSRLLPPWRFCAADGMREVGLAAVAMTALRYEGNNSVRYGDISGLVDQSEVHVDVQVRGPSMLVFSGQCGHTIDHHIVTNPLNTLNIFSPE